MVSQYRVLLKSQRFLWRVALNQIRNRDITSKAQKYCPMSAAAEIIADHWSVIILRDIGVCKQRTFNSILANNNEKISSATLANRLKRMCDIGLLRTINDPRHSQRKIYCLSPAAIDLVPILIDMSIWALTHASPSNEPIALPSNMERPQSQYSKELTDRLRSLHLDPTRANACLI